MYFSWQAKNVSYVNMKTSNYLFFIGTINYSNLNLRI